MVAIINSMTPDERRCPDVIRGSRKRRIAAGSGTQVQDVNRLLKQFMQMQTDDEAHGQGRHGQDAARHEGPDAGPAVLTE